MAWVPPVEAPMATRRWLVRKGATGGGGVRTAAIGGRGICRTDAAAVQFHLQLPGEDVGEFAGGVSHIGAVEGNGKAAKQLGQRRGGVGGETKAERPADITNQ